MALSPSPPGLNPRSPQRRPNLISISAIANPICINRRAGRATDGANRCATSTTDQSADHRATGRSGSNRQLVAVPIPKTTPVAIVVVNIRIAIDTRVVVVDSRTARRFVIGSAAAILREDRRCHCRQNGCRDQKAEESFHCLPSAPSGMAMTVPSVARELLLRCKNDLRPG